MNRVAVCGSCCHVLRARLNAGTPFTRFGRALAAGAAAAAAGTILYYAILASTGYEFGLIAVGDHSERMWLAPLPHNLGSDYG